MDEDREIVDRMGDVRSQTDEGVGSLALMLRDGWGCDMWDSTPGECLGDAGLRLPRGAFFESSSRNSVSVRLFRPSAMPLLDAGAILTSSRIRV